MNIESVRKYCLSLPHVTEQLQWGEHVVFKVGGKMFCILALEPQDVVLSFKASAEDFVALQEQEGIRPAPYLARVQWLAVEHLQVVRDEELCELLSQAYRLVIEKLPRKVRSGLDLNESLKPKMKRLSVRKKSAKQK